MTRTAECCCRQCRVEVRGELALVAVCHCGNCKRRTGSAFGVSVYYPDDAVIALHGNTNQYRIDNERTRQNRHFCTRCGTTLYWRVAAFPGMLGVAGGCFTGAALPAPTHALSDEQRCAWLALPAHWKASLS